MAFLPVEFGKISTKNSTTIIPTTGATFIGDWEDVTDYGFITMESSRTPTGSTGTLFMEFSINGTATTRSIRVDIANDGGVETRTLTPTAQYFRVRYVPDADDLTFFEFQTRYHKTQSARLTSRITDPLTGNEDVETVRAIIFGRKPDMTYSDVKLTSNESLRTAIPWDNLFTYATPTDPTLPSGSSITIDPVLNSESNVIDTGWLPTEEYPGGNFMLLKANTNLTLYVLNASDQLGSNIEGTQFPAAITTAGEPTVIGAPFFDDYFRIIVVNDSNADATEITLRSQGLQTAPPMVYNSVGNNVFDFIPAPLMKAVLTGKKPDDVYDNVALDLDAGLTVSSRQIVDTGNTRTITTGSTSGHVTTIPSVGTPFATRSRNIQENLIVINAFSGGTPITDLGGTLSFRSYLDDGFGNPGIAVAPQILTIKSFEFVKTSDWLSNSGDFFQVDFTPDRDLVGDEIVVIAVTHAKAPGNTFKRRAFSIIEEENFTSSVNQSFLKAFDINGNSVNIRATQNEALRVQDDSLLVTPSGSLFVEGIRDDIFKDFGVNKVDFYLHKLDNYSSGGTFSADYVNGGVDFYVTGASGYSECLVLSERNVQYETGHGMIGEQTIVLNELPEDDAYAEWGFITSDLNDSFGFGADSGGTYTFLIRGGVYVKKTYQQDWNRDKCDGERPSLFKFNDQPQALSLLKNNLFRSTIELLYAAEQKFKIKTPYGKMIEVDVNEYGNQDELPSMTRSDLKLFIKINSGVNNQQLSIKSGSWRGGVHTSKSVQNGLNPDEIYVDIRANGRHSGNSTTTPLDANGVWYGKWFEWQGNYVKMLLESRSDVAGTIYVQFSGLDLPLDDGTDNDVTGQAPFNYVPSTDPTFRYHFSVQSRWVRLKYINGIAAQAYFELDTGFVVNDVGTPSKAAQTEINFRSLTSQTDAIITARRDESETGGNITFSQLRFSTNDETNKAGLNTTITKIEDSVALKPLPTWQVRQQTVGQTATLLDSVKLAGRKAIQIKNHSSDTAIFIGHSSAVSPSNGELVPAQSATGMLLSDLGDVWGVSQNIGGTSMPYTISGTSATGTATNPSNVLASDDTYAIYSATGQTVTVSGFTSPTTNPIQTIGMTLESKKNTTPSTETVQFIDIQTNTVGNVGSITSPTVTGNTAHFYVVSVSWDNTAANVTAINGMGLTWTLLTTVTNGTSTKIAVYYSVGTGVVDGGVTVSFSNLINNGAIAVARYSNVDTTAPITNFATNTGSNSSTISGSLASTTVNGRFVYTTAQENRTSTPTGGSTERCDLAAQSGPASTYASLTLNDKQVTATPTNYSATLNGNANWSAIVFVLEPRLSIAPTLRLSYTLSGNTGATSGIVSAAQTTDTIGTIDISGDEDWVYQDIPFLTITATLETISQAHAYVDRIYLSITDTTGNTVRVSIKEIG